MSKGLLRAAAWLALALVALATLGPRSVRPHLPIGHDVEHLLAFLALGGALAVAYPTRRGLALAGGVAFAILIEVVQVWAPGRHAQLRDAAFGTAGVVLAVGVVALLDAMRRGGFARPRSPGGPS